MTYSRTIKSLLFGSLVAGLMLSTARANNQQWDFTVYLDDDAIGYHRFSVNREKDKLHVVSEASFDVKFLFFTAYEYRHYNHETWQDGCLLAVNAATDDNGDTQIVKGKQSNGNFRFSSPDAQQDLTGCIRSFAYWSPALLQTTRLLNPQTGQYQKIDFQHLGPDVIEVQNQSREANRYQIRNPEFVIDLWYSDDNQWLALESTTKQGARLRYRIQ